MDQLHIACAFRRQSLDDSSDFSPGKELIAISGKRLQVTLGKDFRIYNSADALTLADESARRPKPQRFILAVEVPHTHHGFMDVTDLVGSFRDRYDDVAPFAFVSNLAHSKPHHDNPDPEGVIELKRRLEAYRITYTEFLKEDFQSVFQAWLDFLNKELEAITL